MEANPKRSQSSRFSRFHEGNGSSSNGEKYYLLIDNAKIHRAIKILLKKKRLSIRELLVQMNIDPLYLVAYCPALNPVELIFNFLRSYMEKHEPRTFEELLKIHYRERNKWIAGKRYD